MDYYGSVKVQIGTLVGRPIVVLLRFNDSFLLKTSTICYTILRSCCFTVLNKAGVLLFIWRQYSPSYSYSFWCKGPSLFSNIYDCNFLLIVFN